MELKLYVGNLSYDTTEDSVQANFSEAGTVTSVDMIMDRETGRPKGVDFITMSNQAEAEAAIRMFYGKLLDNRELKVNIAQPREHRPQRSEYGGYSNKRRR